MDSEMPSFLSWSLCIIKCLVHHEVCHILVLSLVLLYAILIYLSNLGNFSFTCIESTTILYDNIIIIYLTAMLIGFGTRSTTIHENKFQDLDSFQEQFNVVSLRRSELTHTMTFSVRGQRTAEVVAEDQAFSPDFPNWDASFGARSNINPSDPPFIPVDLTPGLLMLPQDLSLVIHNDLNVEDTKFFTLRITPRDVGRGVFECYDDTEVPNLGNFFCSHTFYIVDNDGMF